MKHTVNWKVHCVRLCTESKKTTRELDLKRTDNREPVTDFLWVCTDSYYFSCWHKFHIFYEPQHMFANTGSIVEKQAKTLHFGHFGHLRVGNDLCMKKKLAFGKMFS
jgi:hypothetical protein